MAPCFAMFAIKMYQVDPLFSIAVTTGIGVYHAMRFNIKEKNLNLNQLIRLCKVKYVPAVNAVNY